MKSGDGNGSLMSDINVTPFVDVMLVLLIIFMVTAPMMIQGVNISLPEATSEPLPAEHEQILITIDKKNQIYINEFQVSLEFLKDKLSKIFRVRPDREVYLRADRRISYGTVVRVMSEIKGAGVEKLGMVTEPVSRDKQDAVPNQQP